MAMANARNFIDNLRNLRLVMLVALEHVQTNCDQFSRTATGNELRQVEGAVSQIRTIAAQLEKEFNTLEYLAAKRERGLS